MRIPFIRGPPSALPGADEVHPKQKGGGYLGTGLDKCKKGHTARSAAGWKNRRRTSARFIASFLASVMMKLVTSDRMRAAWESVKEWFKEWSMSH
jgi:hypothetical protein